MLGHLLGLVHAQQYSVFVSGGALARARAHFFSSKPTQHKHANTSCLRPDVSACRPAPQQAATSGLPLQAFPHAPSVTSMSTMRYSTRNRKQAAMTEACTSIAAVLPHSCSTLPPYVYLRLRSEALWVWRGGGVAVEVSVCEVGDVFAGGFDKSAGNGGVRKWVQDGPLPHSHSSPPPRACSPAPSPANPALYPQWRERARGGSGPPPSCMTSPLIT